MTVAVHAHHAGSFNLKLKPPCTEEREPTFGVAVQVTLIPLEDTMNRTFAVMLVCGLLSSGVAFAQDASTNASPNPPAVATGHADTKTSAAPVPGKNSFTKKQTAKRLRDHGYSSVKGLTKDDQGIWHGTAMKSGASVNVSVDFQGNITEQ